VTDFSAITGRVAEMRAVMAAHGPGPAGEACARDRPIWRPTVSRQIITALNHLAEEKK